MHVEVYQDKAGQYRWRLIAANGRIVADSSEGYVDENNAYEAVELVRSAFDKGVEVR